MRDPVDPRGDLSSGKTPLMDLATLKFYETNARSYVQARLPDVSADLLRFLPCLKSGSFILELGCGSGHDALEMERLGHRVDATDGVAAMAAIANERLAGSARVLRFDELDVFEHYDAVVACASLLHVPGDGLPDIIRRIWSALRPNGWHFASFKTDGQPGWDKYGRYYNYPAQVAAAETYRSAGEWSSLTFDTFDGTGYFSQPARWLTVTARKKG